MALQTIVWELLVWIIMSFGPKAAMTKALHSEGVKHLCSLGAAKGAVAALGQNAEEGEDSQVTGRDLCLCLNGKTEKTLLLMETVWTSRELTKIPVSG